MSESLNKIKPEVRALRPYSLRPDRATIKLNQNENPWNAPAEIIEESLRRWQQRTWSRYPDFVPRALCESLAQFSGWSADGIIAGNGSNELIQATLMVTTGRASRVLISEPTFALYRQIVTILGGEIVSVPLNAALHFDLPRLKSKIEESRPDLLIICSPNNPTGCLLPREELEDLLDSFSGLIVIDEAYHEFSGQTVVPLLAGHHNLVVLRTFSKAMGLAALRVGYLLAAPELTREIAKAVLPYNLNALSQIAAGVAVEMYQSNLRPLVELICAERDRLYRELSTVRGLAPVVSQANFMVVRSAIEPRRIFSELLTRDILVRDVSRYPLLNDYFRVSVGTPEENDQLIAALQEICA
jgi:histidinol-phosphate aminotransferase